MTCLDQIRKTNVIRLEKRMDCMIVDMSMITKGRFTADVENGNGAENGNDAENGNYVIE